MGNFEFKKKFGQNFLTDKNLLEEIVEKAGVESDDTVVEIGVGKGALTEVLSRHARRVIAFEIDRELIDFLKERFNGTNVELIFKDIMKVEDDELDALIGEKFKLVANLPYYITSPIITRFLQNKNLTSMSVMVQEEVADRIISRPRTKDYGVLTVICQMFAKTQKLIRVNRKMFYPVPNVDSAVIKLDKFDGDFYKNPNELISFVKKAFSMRRKKLSTNLESEKHSKSEIETKLCEIGFNANTRAEELSILDFEKLYNKLYDKNV
ncbi:MAG: ribosomal RNA small subunit methyltransferase A [Clostridia bacterium]|nr:ribosomal RNA small subunit methyltransferase A [Clostridia bacterium]